MLTFYRAAGFGSDTTAIFYPLHQKPFQLWRAYLQRVRAANISTASHMDLNACAVLSAQSPAYPCYLSVYGSGHQTLSLRPRSPPAIPRPHRRNAATEQHTQSAPPSRYGTGAPSPSTQTSGQWSASRRLQRPCPPPRRMQRRNAHTLADCLKLLTTTHTGIHQRRR